MLNKEKAGRENTNQTTKNDNAGFNPGSLQNKMTLYTAAPLWCNLKVTTTIYQQNK